MALKLFVGLGNPGTKFKKTRHNVGFLCIDEFLLEISKHVLDPNFEFSKKYNSDIFVSDNFIFAKPQTFMNASGDSVSSLATFYKIQPTDIFIIHDDLDIALGEYKIQKGKGPKDHNGLNSIYEKLGTKDFWHVRIGINNQESRINNQGSKILGEEYVLMKFTDDEMKSLNSIFPKIQSDWV